MDRNLNPAVILHLSDTHRTAEEQVSNAELLQYLTRDIRGYTAQGIPTPNIVLISGDITQRAEVAEYTEAEELITGLLAELKLSKDHLILVPGNHDVHWPNAEKTMKVGAGTTTFQKEVAFKAGPLTLHFEDEAAFQERLENFRNFYSRVKGRDYPKLRAGSFTLDDFPNLGLTVVGLSSVDRVHQHYRIRSGNRVVTKRGALTQARVHDIAQCNQDLVDGGRLERLE